MSFAKPEPRPQVKARERREHAKARRKCQLSVWARESGHCQRFLRAVRKEGKAHV
jgi:hypothetical protein